MATIDVKTAEKEQGKRPTNEMLATSALTMLSAAMGTGALVGIHHYYRKQQQPDASLWDYLAGVRTQLHILQASPKLQLTHLRYAYQQASAAWQRAYHDIDNKNHDSKNIVTDLKAIHSTIMLARPVCWVSGVASMPKNISLPNDHDSADENGFGVVGIDADRQIVWQTTMPERVHDIVVQPITDFQNRPDIHNRQRHVVVMGRRPSEKFWVLDTATGQVKFAIKAADNRHFYGHACYSLDGSKLYVTENDTISLTGKIGIYDACDNYQKTTEFDSHGIGPHELIMHPDDETLIIANGGIKTEQASREELNLDTMRPSLTYLNRHNGQLLEQITPEHNQMSVRHLAIHDDGTVMIGVQFQGERHINVPLVLIHQRGDADFTPLIMPNDQWQRFHQYIASVAVDSQNNLLCVTTPIGGCAAVFDLSSHQLIDAVSLPDCAGTSLATGLVSDQTKSNHGTSGFIVSDGQGQLTALSINTLAAAELATVEEAERIFIDSKYHMMSFDNHLQAVSA